MAMIPTAIILIWFSGLLSLGIIGGAVYLLYQWYQTAWVYDRLLDRVVFNPDIGMNAPTALLVGGLLLLIWAIAGGFLVRLFLRLTSRNSTHEQPTPARDGRIQRLQRPDGTELQIERYGRTEGPTLIFTHGWGTDSTEWYYVKRQLADRFQIIVWCLLIATQCANQKPASASTWMCQPPKSHRLRQQSTWALWNITRSLQRSSVILRNLACTHRHPPTCSSA